MPTKTFSDLDIPINYQQCLQLKSIFNIPSLFQSTRNGDLNIELGYCIFIHLPLLLLPGKIKLIAALLIIIIIIRGTIFTVIRL